MEWRLGSGADHGRSEKRAVTLFQAEHLPVIASLLNRPVDFERTRRNVLVAGINLEVCVGRRLRVGAAILELTARCHPCRRMDEAFGQGGFAAMFGHGGWCARILEPATIHLGDPVRLDDVPQLPLL